MPTTRPRTGRTTRRGRWTYDDHPELNLGWLLRGTTRVLDYDAHHDSGTLTGCYQLWRDGWMEDPID